MKAGKVRRRERRADREDWGRWWDAESWWPATPRGAASPPVDFDFVTDRIATGGGIWTADDVQRLKAAGITHVVTTADELAPQARDLVAPVMPVLVNGTVDDGKWKDAEWFGRTIRFSVAALQDPTAKVYLHCWSGKNRGPSSAYAVMRAIGYDAATARSLIETARPKVKLLYVPDAEAALKGAEPRRERMDGLEEGRARKEAGQASALEHAGPAWRALADAELLRLARSGEEFTADDITAHIGVPGEPNAIGSLFSRWSKRGVIITVGYRQSERADRNAGTNRIWRGTLAAADYWVPRTPKAARYDPRETEVAPVTTQPFVSPLKATTGDWEAPERTLHWSCDLCNGWMGTVSNSLIPGMSMGRCPRCNRIVSAHQK